MTELMTWGKSNERSSQGWMYRPIDRRYWTAYWSDLWDTIKRDGKIKYDDATHEYVSENRRIVSIPYAIPDDFGCLVGVMQRDFIGGPDRVEV